MTTPRSLADDLRGRDDAALEMLVRRRSDLALPTPGDLGQLAGRSVTAASTASLGAISPSRILRATSTASAVPSTSSQRALTARDSVIDFTRTLNRYHIAWPQGSRLHHGDCGGAIKTAALPKDIAND